MIRGGVVDSEPDSGIHRHRLVVVAAGVDEVVGAVGGFLYDRARAGWKVSVLLRTPCDTRPLTILGIGVQDADADVASVIGDLARGGALAVGTNLLDTDADIREAVTGLAMRNSTEVTVWGPADPAETGRGLEPMAHSLSVAAKAFKAHALRAAGRDDDSGMVAPTETLFRLHSFRRLHSV